MKRTLADEITDKAFSETIYSSKTCKELFQAAYKRFPGHNCMNEQAEEAAEWIRDELEFKFDQVKWTDGLREELGEMIIAGLT